MRRGPGVATFAAALLLACDGGVQDRTATPCSAGCIIALDTVWASDPTNPDLSRTYSPIERGDSLLIVNAFENTYIAVLGPTGKTIRVVGRAGDGPGEYRSISAIDLDADGRIYVFDRRRLTMLDTTLQVVFTTPFPVTVERGVALGDRTMVVDGSRRVRDSTYALHRLAEDGRILGSFAASTPESGSLFIARGRENTIWAAARIAAAPVYRIDRWDPGTGRLLQTIRDDPEWFRWSPPQLSSNQLACGRGRTSACDAVHDEERAPHPPMPAIFDMWESREGLLWVTSFKADRRWKEASLSDPHRRFDSVLEVRDARTGVLIAALELDQYATGFTNTGSLMLFELDDQAQPRHTLIAISLSRATESGK